jgi:hypothetical protein
MTNSLLLKEIESRWRVLFKRLANGDDAPPGLRLRLEGLMEAAQLTGSASAKSMQETMDGIHVEVFGEPIAASCGERWQSHHPFPQIPVFARRAPVSTGKVD